MVCISAYLDRKMDVLIITSCQKFPDFFIYDKSFVILSKEGAALLPIAGGHLLI